ncbi:MAG: hypothetical protein CMJ83_00170 [Planctomycetes bacterium]|nr:hypothetical protein [Planctomycetota bacterium]
MSISRLVVSLAVLTGVVCGQDSSAPERYIVKDTLGPMQDPNPAAQAMLDRIAWKPGSFTAEVHRGPKLVRVRYPSPKPRGDARNDRVTMEWYAPKGPLADGGAPAVLVMHILDGRMRVARIVAKSLARRGIHGFVMYMPDYGDRGDRRARHDVRRFVDRSLQGVADARRAHDVIARFPGVDGKRVGIQGTSLGGFGASVAGAIDGVFDPVFLLLSGADLAQLIQSGKRDTAHIRRRFLASGLSMDETKKLVTQVDPIHLAHRLPVGRTWLYSARRDTVVPPACATALAKAAKLTPKRHVWISADHYTGLPYLPAVVLKLVKAIRGE